jgi:hypothetical protein
MNTIPDNTIPPITEPLGRHWHAPDRALILTDDKHAVMAGATFVCLPEYSGTIPTGVYPGKMWKRNDGLFDERCKPEDRKWLLCWFGPVIPANERDREACPIEFRQILIA